MKRSTVIIIGALATFGAFMGVMADVFSAWSPNSNEMGSAFSVDLDSIRSVYEDKPRWTYVLGNYFGVFFIPLHTLGFFMVYRALKPANAKFALAFFALALYVVPVGVGLHGTLAFVGDIFQSGDPNLINGMRDFWQPWAYSLVIMYTVLSIMILIMILTGRSLYPKSTVFLSPIVIVATTFLAITILPDSIVEVKSFLSVTGLNLPLVVFFTITTWVLARCKETNL